MSSENPFNIKTKKTDDSKKHDSVNPNTNPNLNKNQNYKPKYKKKLKKYPSTAYTNEQIKELLVGYIEVRKDKWSDIPVGSHIRYVKKDGTFVRGGFVTNHWLNKEGKQFIHIANNLKKNSPNYATWPMAHESVARLFKKPDAKTGIELDVVRGKTAEIISQINKLVNVVKEQGRRLDKQELEIQRILKNKR